ncbi:hypothetical protein BBJ28_00013977 [Nothophytophthora sp. Chile5]|nr:hypothetical protein BBJ28_00013977 [Nothophytophthora sp. Chile5]
MWLEAAMSDISLGKELLPVPVHFPARDSHLRLATVMGLMEFSYVTARIRQGEYVGQYTGELISSNEARRRYQERYDREERNYVLALREHVARQDVAALRFDVVRTNVDASSCGSVTRFINHSCAPNLEVAAVRVDSYVPRLELFASKPIERGEELSFDYGAGSQSLVKIWAFAMEKTYDELCEDASAAAETRLLDHFKQHGGEVWAIGAGCQSCRQKLADTSGLKCGVISTFQRVRKTAFSASQLRCFQPLRWLALGPLQWPLLSDRVAGGRALL